MKTPLNGIINLPLLIKQEKNLSSTQSKRLDLIEDAGYKLLTMLNNSLDLYKMEEGTYIYAPAPVDLFHILGKINAALWSEMQENETSVEVFLNGAPAGSNYSFLVQGEELLCYSMLANLIKNAVEASPWAKKIRISLDNSSRPEIKIHNHGQVPTAIHDKFFQKYVTAGKKQGTGLGTYSARLMARTMNGDISMTSSPSNGTTIKITMRSPSNGTGAAKIAAPNRETQKPGSSKPAGTAQHKHKAELSSSSAHTKLMPLRYKPSSGEDKQAGAPKRAGKQILLAEDDPINQALATALLEEHGFVVTLAVNGEEALALYKEKSFDLVLMDMQMPLLSGVEATKLIRKEEEATGRRVPIIAVTGMQSEKHFNGFIEAGGNAVVAKPIQIDLLWQAITNEV
jgi:CheY-like chemotaxis protein